MYRVIIVLVAVLLLLVPSALYAQETEVEGSRLIIESVDVDAEIVHVPQNRAGNWAIEVIGNDVGHLELTAWIDSPGNIVLAGHLALADGTPGVFADIDDLAQGDEIILVQPDSVERHYMIESVYVVAWDDLRPIYPTEDDHLTLITCRTFDPVNSFYLERLIVSAVRVQ